MNAEQVQNEVARQCGVSRRELVGKDKHRSLSRARQLAMLICRDALEMSYPEIGRAFGNRDHTTAMSGIANARRKLADETVWRDELRRIHRGLATGITKAPVSTVRYRVAV